VQNGGGQPNVLTAGGSSLNMAAVLNTDPIFTGNSFGGGAAHSHGLDMRIKYVDSIFAQKD
jgi:hypothetical protein